MNKVDILILGAGPAGLTLANRLLDKGITSFLILEKEKNAGGLCRSDIVDGSPIDIGGGHFLDVKRKEVLDFIYRFLPKEEWQKFNRRSNICIGKKSFIDYPYEANIWQMPIEKQADYLMDISKAGCNNGIKEPESFEEWIVWKLGKKIAEDYMLPYNHKIWSIDLNKLGTYWMEKLPDVSFKETLLSCLAHSPYGQLPAHAQFYYPKQYGFGEVWLRMADRLQEHINYEVEVSAFDVKNLVINNTYQGNLMINTIPWSYLEKGNGIPDQIRDQINTLEFSSIVVEYHENMEVDTRAHWTYFPDEKLDYHRILWRENFCGNSKGAWTETNLKRYQPMENKYHYLNHFAYPLNTIRKQQAIQEILEWGRMNRIIGLGRWGEWEHFNTDVVVEKALRLSECL